MSSDLPEEFFQGADMPTAGVVGSAMARPSAYLPPWDSAGPGMEVVDLCSGDGWLTLQIAKIPRHVRADRSWFIWLKSRPMTTALSLSDRQRESTMSSILDNKNTSAPSVFLACSPVARGAPAKGLLQPMSPPVCILDPDGDIVRQSRQTGKSQRL